MSELEPREVALRAAEAAAEKKASDVIVMNVGPMLVITEYFVIATGSTDRQVKAIAEEIEDRLRDIGIKPVGREGEREARWVLLDFDEIVVHVFQPDEREFYRLERLWSDAARVDLPPEVANTGGVGQSSASPAATGS
ncbi:MAG: ribosome silencing factor [Actinomycetia bacterium]|nr:ribosome silencing factor [Actinomycetes bacterium]